MLEVFQQKANVNELDPLFAIILENFNKIYEIFFA